LKKLDRYCSIVFDEIALSPSLQYTDGNIKVIGFKDLGGPYCSSDFVDKALVFMIRGSRKKFKQQIAFYLTNSTIDGTNLSIIIKNINGQFSTLGFLEKKHFNCTRKYEI